VNGFGFGFVSFRLTWCKLLLLLKNYFGLTFHPTHSIVEPTVSASGFIYVKVVSFDIIV